MERYARIVEKRPREIVLLRGAGCAWRKCAFCDYYHDAEPDPKAALALNRRVLARVTGEFGELEVINSGSVFELDDATIALVRDTCRERGIGTLHVESHWLYRGRIPALRAFFSPIELKLKLGLETFDAALREDAWHKGIAEQDPGRIAEGFDEANLLVGVPGQTVASMERDVELGLEHFERVCVNVMCENSTPVEPDPQVVGAFMEGLYPRLADDPRVDVLVANTDFGVGSPAGEAVAA